MENLKDKTIEQLKVMAYDALSLIQTYERVLQAVNNEINIKNNEAASKPTGFPTRVSDTDKNTDSVI
jgi:hypothetical protein